MKITSFNPDTDELERSALTFGVNEGQTTIKVANNDNMKADSILLIGEMGDEHTEIAYVDTDPTGPNTVSLEDELVFDHDVDDPVYVLDFDEVHFLKATSLDGTYAVVHTTQFDVDNADKQTVFNDSTSTASNFYKTQWYNTKTTESSGLSGAIQASGPSRKSIGWVIDRVVKRVRDPGYTIFNIDQYLDLAQEVNDDLISQSQRPYTFLHQTVTLDRVAGQNYVELPENMVKFDYVQFTDLLGGVEDTYQIKKPASMEVFRTRTRFSNVTGNRVFSVALDGETNRLYLDPAPVDNLPDSVTLAFWGFFKDFEDIDDLVQTPNTLIYRYKMMAEYYAEKATVDSSYNALATRYETKYGQEIVKMQRMNRLDAGSQRSMADGIKKTDPYFHKRYSLRG